MVLLTAGLVATVGGGSWWAAAAMEGSMQADAATLLAGSPVAVSFSGRDATVTGDTADEVEAAAAVVQAMPGVRTVTPQLRVPTPAPAPSVTVTPPASITRTTSASPSTTAGPTLAPTSTPTLAPTPSATTPAPEWKAVQFGGGSASLTAQTRPQLDEVAAYLVANPGVRIVAVGHTDPGLTAAARRALSLRRANAVKEYLVSRGVAADRIAVDVRAETEPVASNSTPEGRALNRRVEIRVQG